MKRIRTLFPLIALAGLACGVDAGLNVPRETNLKKHTPYDDIEVHPPIHPAAGGLTDSPTGLTPDLVRKAYKLPSSGGAGNTIAVVIAFDVGFAEEDLNTFSAAFGLPACTMASGCFEKYKIDPTTPINWGWSIEGKLDIEWAHAIAPDAKILLVVAKSNLNVDLLEAVDYARTRPDVVAVSMSWGRDELPPDIDSDKHFTSDHDVVFFAASGDSGHMTTWPAVSPNVVAVGGTHLDIMIDGTVVDEKVWRWSGGGASSVFAMPGFQKDFGLNYRRPPAPYNPNSPLILTDAPDIEVPAPMRATPDVAYHADSNPGFAIFLTFSDGTYGWWEVGGTSAGTPQWAAIHALGLSANNQNFYARGASADHAKYFRDITIGYNGYCGWLCKARPGYDYTTGFGSPLTIDFK